MKTFKVICKIQIDGVKVNRPIYVKNCKDVNEAETKAKRYWIIDNPEIPYFGVVGNPEEI